jgi:hypothetical protein
LPPSAGIGPRDLLLVTTLDDIPARPPSMTLTGKG